jgi:hypothetical protein
VRHVPSRGSDKVWHKVFVCRSSNLKPILPWMVGVVINEEAVNFAYHFPHSIRIVVFKLDLLLLALLRPQSASES